MLSKALKAKIRKYYDERVAWIRQQGLVESYTPTYRLSFTKSKGYVGQCNYTKQVINISEVANRHATWESIVDTINHELAHWLTPGEAHGEVWQEMAVRLGAAPETRCSVGSMQKPYVIMKGTEIVGYSETYYPAEVAANRYIKGQKKQTLGWLRWEPNPDMIDNANWVEPSSVKRNRTIEDFLSDI